MRRPVRAGAISVVIPSYNHEAYLEDAVGSILGQTLAPDELVVVDDGSTDGSPELLERLRFKEMRLELQENRGAHRAINRAIELSRGEYIAILNSDDVFERERIEHAWGVARTAGAALLCGEVRLIDEDGGEPPEAHAITRWYEEARLLGRSAPSLAYALRRHNVAVTTSNFFVHRALWEQLGGFRPYRYVHDYDFILRAMALCPDRVVYEASLCDVRYRVHGANTISEAHDRALAERAEMLQTVTSPSARARAVVGRMGKVGAVGRSVDETGMLQPVRPGIGSVESGADSVRPAEVTVGLVVTSLDVGGLEEVVAMLAQALPSEGLRVAIYCTESGGAVAERLVGVGVPVTERKAGGSGCGEWVVEAGIDVVSSHFVSVDVLREVASREVPVVETVHNTYAWLSDDEWVEERARADLVAGIVSVSRIAGDYFADRTGRSVDRVIPNAVHPARATAVPREFARRRLEIDSTCPLFVSVGRVTRQKNVSGLLAAFASIVGEVPDARLLLAGPADESESWRALRAAHRPLFESDRVRWLGATENVGSVLCAADAFVSNSWYEGWSVAASEAAWLGLPLILSDAGGAADLVGVDGADSRAGARPGSMEGPIPGARGFLVPNPGGDPALIDDAVITARARAEGAPNEAALGAALREVVNDLHGWRLRSDEISAWARSTLTPSAMAAAYAEELRAAVRRSRRG